MTFYPMFIPIAGGGPPPGKAGWIALAALSGCIAYTLWYNIIPQYKMCIDKDEYNYILKLKRSGPHAATNTKHNNFMCLIDKGYKVYPIKTDSIYREWTDTVYISADKVDIKQLVADCKECKVNTEINYEYESEIMGNIQRRKKVIEWNACHIVGPRELV